MLISHQHHFIFVHVWKTGGNSIRKCLEPFSEDLFPKQESLFRSFFKQLGTMEKSNPAKIDQHITFKELRTIIGAEDFKKYFKFAFVRNPLDLLVSYYHFIVQHENKHPQKDYIRSLKTFEDYVKWSEENEMIKLSQKRFVVDESGDLLADYLGRFEKMQESFHEITGHIGIKMRTLPILNSSNHDHYLAYYNSSTESIVRSVLSEDFALFNY